MSDDKRSKKDWSLAESMLRSRTPGLPEPKQAKTSSEGSLVPTDDPAVLPLELTISPPDTIATQGILARFKANQLGRKAALAELDEKYKGQLELLKHRITEQVRVGKTQVSAAAEDYLRKLDAKHLELLAELGMRNAAMRWKAVTDLTDMTVAKVAEVEGKEWPAFLIEDTMKKIFDLRERVANEIMKELGIEYAKE